MNKILTFLAGIFLCISSFAQTFDNSFELKQQVDSLHIRSDHRYHDFVGFYGYFLISSELIPVRQDLFRNLVPDEHIPTVALSPIYDLIWISFLRNWMYSNISWSHTFVADAENDSLVSRLHQNSLGLHIGYNIVRQPFLVISLYTGLRFTHFRQTTNLKKGNISLANYMAMRDIDLRVSQFSGEIGLNGTIVLKNMWCVGMYFSYLADFNTNALVRSRRNRINNRMGNPVGNLVIGLGVGYGTNQF